MSDSVATGLVVNGGGGGEGGGMMVRLGGNASGCLRLESLTFSL